MPFAPSGDHGRTALFINEAFKKKRRHQSFCGEALAKKEIGIRLFHATAIVDRNFPLLHSNSLLMIKRHSVIESKTTLGVSSTLHKLPKHMTLIISYLKLCRFDALLISFFTYIIGAEIGEKADMADVIVAVAVTCVSTNFIYAFNAWTDRDIDKINKGYRPIPSGKIPAWHALTYAMVLLGLSVIYPFFIHVNGVQRFLFLLLPALGLLYSAEPFRFRRHPILATITISTGLNIPILLGYLMNSATYTQLPFFFTLFVYCLAVIPLKQIEEEKEDKHERVINLYTRHGQGVITFSMAGLVLNGVMGVFIIADTNLRLFAMILNMITLIVILLFPKLNRKIHQLYTVIIRTVIMESILFLSFLKLFG